MSRTWTCEICGWRGSGTSRSIHCDRHRKEALEILLIQNQDFSKQLYLNWNIVIGVLKKG
jgi:hypothetical protein